MADLEIRISSRNLAKPAFEELERQAKGARDELGRLERAAKVDSKVNMDDSEIADARRELEEIDQTTATAEVELEAVDLSNWGNELQSQVSGFLGGGGPLAAIVGTAAVTFGGDFVEGFTAGFGRRQTAISVGIRTGLDRIEVGEAGELAGELYTSGFGEGLGDLSFQVAAVGKELQNFDIGTSDLQLNKELALLNDQFGIELPQSIEVSQRAVATGLTPTISDALNQIFRLSTELPLTFDEGLDVLKEYAPTVSGINLDMDEFVSYLVEVQRSGQFENLSQGAEALREFNTRLLETETLDPVLAEIGLSSEQIRDAWSNGQAAAAIEAINVSLGESEDQYRANEIAALLFGTAVEDSSDRLATLDAISRGLNSTLGEQERTLSDATVEFEENRSGLEDLKRDVTSFAAGAGEAYGSYYQTVSEGTEQFLRDVTGAHETVEGEITGLSSALNGIPEVVARGGRSFHDFGADAEEAADGLIDLEQATGDLEGAMRSLSDWADGTGEAALRRVHESADEITTRFEEAGGAAFSLADGWDLTTEAGRKASEITSQLRSDVADLTEEYLEGRTGPDAFRAAIADLEGSLREFGRSMGLRGQDLDDFVASITQVPTLVGTDVEVDTRTAHSRLETLNAQLDALDGRTVNTHLNNIINYYRGVGSQSDPVRPRGGPRAHGGVVGSAQSGGVRNGLTLVGEEGPELVDLAPGSQVFSTPDTARIAGQGGAGMLGGMGAGPGMGMNVTVNVSGSVLSERDLVGVIKDELARGGLLDGFTSGAVTANL